KPGDKETVQKVCDIVKKQLALPEGSSVTGESKFAAFGADSLYTHKLLDGNSHEISSWKSKWFATLLGPVM
ncbi:hypothetical protein S83_063754, partial [Arachis hypogaea]